MNSGRPWTHSSTLLWYLAWSKCADGLVAQAAAAEAARHAVSAASLRLRATEYYRQAFDWLDTTLR